MRKNTYSVKEKKVLKWANGLGVFITTEAKKFGWNDKTKLLVSAIEDSEGKKIIITKAKESHPS